MADHSPESNRRSASTLFLLALALIALYFCYLIAKPFLTPSFLAVMMAIVFHPVHARIQARLPSRNGAALLSRFWCSWLWLFPALHWA